ncbi:DUF5063 domain-containing protein [Neolewinella litorea]|uniref:DUF5063 domain-containing protein n=1 Tax=Neolewinella litorea TaxID=2562452 RepID=A0A4S4NCS8_9BACT|nr:DUF5063 domain-containing protein [Neolewinella litorea]THH36297.1 DUF5063 domain-containing protein [Neolewinella litorea]
MEELIEIINEIIKYGLNPNIEIEDKEKDLEINLVKLYSKYFQIDYVFDENEYEDFNKKKIYPNVIESVKSNFKDFGWYHSILNLEEILKQPETGTGDAIDDLSDIIYDLLEIKWRSENNSENDAWWFFELMFYSHTQQHLINLLNYLKNKNG